MLTPAAQTPLFIYEVGRLQVQNLQGDRLENKNVVQKTPMENERTGGGGQKGRGALNPRALSPGEQGDHQGGLPTSEQDPDSSIPGPGARPTLRTERLHSKAPCPRCAVRYVPAHGCP